MRNDRLNLTPGNRYQAAMPYSEACMHLKVAGKTMWFEIVGDEYPMVQLLERRGPDVKQGDVMITPLQVFSFPITLGEGGVFKDETGFYCYPEMNLD